MDKRDRDYIAYHEKCLEQVTVALREYPQGRQVDLGQISKNIDYLKQEIKTGKTDDLHGLFYQLNAQYSMVDRFAKAARLPDTDNPYFAYMKIEHDGKTREVFLGHLSFLPPDYDVRIVDWAKAPISRIYFNYQEGEEFDLDLPNKTISGYVLEKAILTIKKGELVRIDRLGKSFVKLNDSWQLMDEEVTTLEGGQGSACRELNLGSGQTNLAVPDVISLLDRDQFDILHQDDANSLLITGGAGSGKTTAALHRIAVLCHKKNYRAEDILVVVPQTGLAALSRNLLNNIKLEKVRVSTASQWLVERSKNLFYGLPKKMTPETPLSVSLLKRHGSIIELCKRFVRKQEEELVARLKANRDASEVVKLIKKRVDQPILSRLHLIERNEKNPLVKMALKEERKRLSDFNQDRQELFSDKKLLSQLLEISGGVITNRMVESTVVHTVYQMRSKDAGPIDEQTLDGQDIDSGSSFELSGTIDPEDFPIMLYLLRIKNGMLATRKGSLKRYRHIVLDEAQEYAPIELIAFKEMCKREGTFTVAGDAAQQIDETLSFHGWDSVLSYLEIEEADSRSLNISYRSPQSIVEFAHKVLGPFAPPEMPKSLKKGRAVGFTEIQHRAHSAMILNDALIDLLIREPNASVAIICNRVEFAQSLYNGLQGVGKVRLVTNGDFTFKHGVDVTTVDQIKGLEFDYVVIPDVDRIHYPDKENERKRLHLAATRAIHQLWIFFSEDRSPILNDLV